MDSSKLRPIRFVLSAGIVLLLISTTFSKPGIKPIIKGQPYFCKVFRLANVQDTVLAVPTWSNQGQEQIFSDSILNGFVGEYDGASVLIRFVAIWDTNNKDYLKRDTFSISLEQRHVGAIADTIRFDSLLLVFVPSGESHALTKGRTSGSLGNDQSGTWVRTSFENVIVPAGVDTVRVSFVGMSGSQRIATSNNRTFEFLMVRYEGMARRHDWRPKD